MLKHVAGDAVPGVVALAEVENHSVVEDLLAELDWPELIEARDHTAHLDGADVVVLYSKKHFELAGPPRSHNVHNRYATRDIFEVLLRAADGSTLTVLANHWPSRLYPNSEPLRIGLADYCRRLFLDRVQYAKEELLTRQGKPRLPSTNALAKRWDSPVLILGDFNDSPFDPSVDQVLDTTRDRGTVAGKPRLPRGRGVRGLAAYLEMRPRVYNPGWRLLSPEAAAPGGTCYWQGEWYLLDQIMFSRGLLEGAGPRYVENSLRIHAPAFVTSGNRRVSALTAAGKPRPFDPKSGEGVSDHLPLSCQITLAT